LPSITLQAVTKITDSKAALNWSTNAAYQKYFLTLYRKYSSGISYVDIYYGYKDVGFTSTSDVELLIDP